MKTITFASIDYDLAILDKYLQLTDQELVEIKDNVYDIYEEQYKEFRFINSNNTLKELVECLLSLARDFFIEEYCYILNEQEDYVRHCVYLQHLNLVDLWLKGE